MGYDDISKYAGLQFTPEEIELLLELDNGSISDDTEMTSAYMRGRLKAQVAARAQIVARVQQGDSSALRMFLQLALQSEPDIEYDED